MLRLNEVMNKTPGPGYAIDVDDDNFPYNYAKNRTFLKQLVKDNIDITLFENELFRHAPVQREKTWRGYFLGILRSRLLQVVLSFLVLLDAGIVISEMVLEIQSLQTYKIDFHEQLTRARHILCNILELPTFRLFRHSRNHLPIEADLSLTTSNFPDAFALYNSCFLTKNEHPALLKTHNDNKLLDSMVDILKIWRRIDLKNIHCVIGNSPNEHENKTLVDARGLFHNQDGVFDSSLKRNEINLPHVMAEIQGRSQTLSHEDGDLETNLDMYRPKGAQAMHEASEILHYLSIAITGLFLICVILKVACMGRRFFKDTNQYLDAGIVVASFVSDVIYVRYVSETAAAMVVLLLWRIFRIINALMMHKQQQYELRISIQKRARRAIGRKLEQSRTEIEMRDKHISMLEDLLRDTGVGEDAIWRCKPRYKECTKEQTNNALKSIAALTTGVMGGLVGAPSNLQGVLSKYGGSTTLNTPATSQKSLQQISTSNQTNATMPPSKRPPPLRSEQCSLDYPLMENFSNPCSHSLLAERSHNSSPLRAESRHVSTGETLNHNLLRQCLHRGSSLDTALVTSVPDAFSDKDIARFIDDCEVEETPVDRKPSKESEETNISENVLFASINAPECRSISQYDDITDLYYPRKLVSWRHLRIPFKRKTQKFHSPKDSFNLVHSFDEVQSPKEKRPNSVTTHNSEQTSLGCQNEIPGQCLSHHNAASKPHMRRTKFRFLKSFNGKCGCEPKAGDVKMAPQNESTVKYSHSSSEISPNLKTHEFQSNNWNSISTQRPAP